MAERRRRSTDHRYALVQVRTWTDEKYQALSAPRPNAQTLWHYFLTGKFTTHVPGVIAGGRVAMAEALGWSQKDFDRCWKEIEDQQMAVADWRNGVVYLITAFRQQTNRPMSPSAAASWRRVVRDLPEGPLARRIHDELRVLMASLGRKYLDSYVAGERRDGRDGGGGGDPQGELPLFATPGADDDGRDMDQADDEQAARQTAPQPADHTGAHTGDQDVPQSGRIQMQIQKQMQEDAHASRADAGAHASTQNEPPRITPAMLQDAWMAATGIVMTDPSSMEMLRNGLEQVIRARPGAPVEPFVDDAVRAYAGLVKTWRANGRPGLQMSPLGMWNNLAAVQEVLQGKWDPSGSPRGGARGGGARGGRAPVPVRGGGA